MKVNLLNLHTKFIVAEETMSYLCFFFLLQNGYEKSRIFLSFKELKDNIKKNLLRILHGDPVQR